MPSCSTRRPLCWRPPSVRSILAGGGVRRAGAEAELPPWRRRSARRSYAPPAARAPSPGTTRCPPSPGWRTRHTTELLAGADVLLVVGSSLGEVTSNYFTLRPRGQVIQIEAEPRVLESNLPALGIHADASLALAALLERLTPRPADGRAEQTVAALLAQVRDRLAAQDLAHEQGVLAAIREALPDDAAPSGT